jgi:hypothetical protein
MKRSAVLLRLKCIFLGVLLFALLFFAYWAISRPNMAAVSASYECISRLSRISSALYEYRLKYGEDPPLVVRGENGEPLYSWRVLLTEFLCPEVYHAFKLDEPWDSPANRVLAKRSTGVFECPMAGAPREGLTNYFAVVEPDGRSRFDWLREKGTPTTQRRGLVIVESTAIDVEWSRPMDLLASSLVEDRQLGSRLISCRHHEIHRGPYAIVSGNSLLKESSGVCLVSP